MISLKLVLFDVFAISLALAAFSATFRLQWPTEVPLIVYQIFFGSFVFFTATRVYFCRGESRSFWIGCALGIASAFLVVWFSPYWMVFNFSNSTLDKLTVLMTSDQPARSSRIESRNIATKAVYIVELCAYIQFSIIGGLVMRYYEQRRDNVRRVSNTA